MARERLSVAALAAVLAAFAVQTPTSARWTPAPHPQQQSDPSQESAAAIAEALALAETGDLTGAIALAEALCAEDDAPDVAFGLLGSLHVEAANFERAMEILRPLAERDGADPGVLYNAGRAAEGLALLQDAATWYGRSLEAQPRSARAASARHDAGSQRPSGRRLCLPAAMDRGESRRPRGAQSRSGRRDRPRAGPGSGSAAGRSASR